MVLFLLFFVCRQYICINLLRSGATIDNVDIFVKKININSKIKFILKLLKVDLRKKLRV